MENLQSSVDEIEMGLENTDVNNRTEEVNDENIDKCALEIPTFGFTDKSWRTDFVLIVEGTRLHVNKAILSLASPVFDTMFHSGFKESSCDEIELPCKKLRNVVDFLRFIYPNTLAQITAESALNLLPLVEEYQVLHLKPRCETAFLEYVCERTPVEELFRILHVACLYKLVNLRKHCVQIACINSQEDIEDAFENHPLPEEAAREILDLLNKKLKETVCEQKLLIDDISRESAKSTEALKANNIELEKQLDILKRYLSSDVRKNKVISLESDSYWRENTIILDLDMDKSSIKSERDVHIWNVPLEICIFEQSFQRGNYLRMEIKTKDYKIDSKLKGRAIIVNRQPKGENETVFFAGSLSSGYPMFCLREDLMTKDRVKKISNGFLSDGHIGIIVQMYMSEPIRG